MLDIQALTKSYGEKDAPPEARQIVLDRIALSVEKNEFVCLLDASGCGKTTLLRIVAGLTDADSGAIRIDGRPVDGPGQDRSMVFQNYGLLPWRTVMGNVEFGLEVRGMPRAERRDICRRTIERVGLAGSEQLYPHQISVGGSSSRVQALIAKRVEGAALNGAFAARAVKYDHLHILGDAAAELPNFIYTWEIVAESALQKKKPALQAFVTATARGARWVTNNPDAAAAISRKVTPDSPAEDIAIATQTMAKKQFFSPTGHLAPEAWAFTVETMVKNGDLPQPMAYGDAVLTEFVDNAAKALGPYTP
jgi:ABC-type cobalamin/Fe3+-siderophores transport system ATPase subunit